MSKQSQPQQPQEQPQEPQLPELPQESAEHAQVRAAVEAAELWAAGLAARDAATDPIDPQLHVDAQMAARAAAYQRDRLQTLEQREFEQQRREFEQAPARPLWHVPLPTPKLGPPNPGVKPDGWAPPPAAGTLAAYQREGFLTELFAAHLADPGDLEKLGALVREICRLIDRDDIASRSKGRPF